MCFLNRRTHTEITQESVPAGTEEGPPAEVTAMRVKRLLAARRGVWGAADFGFREFRKDPFQAH